MGAPDFERLKRLPEEPLARLNLTRDEVIHEAPRDLDEIGRAPRSTG
jgi:hypothetical protein